MTIAIKIRDTLERFAALLLEIEGYYSVVLFLRALADRIEAEHER